MRLTPGALADDVRRAADSIATTTGSSPKLYRPPYGIFTPAGLALAHRHAWTPLLWSRWGRDWRANTTPQEIARLASRDLGAGDVILLHDADHYSARGSHRNTVAALPLLLEMIEEAGLYPTGSGSASRARSHST